MHSSLTGACPQAGSTQSLRMQWRQCQCSAGRHLSMRHCLAGQELRQTRCMGAGRTQTACRRQRQQLQVQALTPSFRNMSMEQRTRALSFAVRDISHLGWTRLRAQPWVAQALRWWQVAYAPFKVQLQRAQAAWQWYRKDLSNFTVDDTKHQWEWGRYTERERNIWFSFTRFILVMIVTAVWMTITPVSLLAGAILPLSLNWIMYDNPWLSPIAIAMSFMLPLKFALFSRYALIWPGLI